MRTSKRWLLGRCANAKRVIFVHFLKRTSKLHTFRRMTEAVVQFKERGNEAFKKEEYASARDLYSQALSIHKLNDELTVTLLSNRAACLLKLSDFNAAVKDCSDAIAISPMHTKSLFRRAVAYESLEECKNASKDLSALLHLEPKNAPGIALMRKVKEQLLQEQARSSEVTNILDSIRKDSSKVSAGLGSLTGLCYEDRNHALDLYRKGGVTWLCEFINHEVFFYEKGLVAQHDHEPSANLLAAVRVLSAASNHKEFPLNVVNIATEDEIYSSHSKRFTESKLKCQVYPQDRSGREKICFSSVCSLLPVLGATPALPAILLFIMNTLKAFPITVSSEPLIYAISKYSGCALLTGLKAALIVQQSDAFTAVTDTLSAFISDSPDYFDTVAKEVDMRMESADARKKRVQMNEQVKQRCKAHCQWAIECGLVDQLVSNIDHEMAMIRQHSANCLGKLVNYVDSADTLKPLLLPYLGGQRENEEPSDDKRVVELTDYPPEPPSVPKFRLRAALEATLLISNPDLGTWALELPGGVSQLHFLVATNDLRCQEVASEVICLAAAMESGAVLLSSVVSSGTLSTLLHAPSAGIRAAAASTITKLSIKAKALSEDSMEVAQILNTALSVLKSANNPLSADAKTSSHTSKGASTDALVSFSAMDEVSNNRALNKKHEQDAAKDKKHTPLGDAALGSSGAVTMTAVERAIESLAAMVGKSYIKEEIVHGSYRVAACVAELTKLDLDARSTAAYGVAHILSSLTVTNRELRALALADKDITPEQYEQMQELQRIKTKDENGQTIEEKKEDSDLDTADLCSRRIKRIVACDAVRFLVKFLSAGSAQTREAAARALRQMCVEVSVRGAIIQQGGLKACCAAACDEDNKKAVRLEAAHAVAKMLITTNPNLLSEHQRLGSIKPLIAICKDATASNLQQFEALLALTNVLSCGPSEHEKFAAEKGVQAVHYLIFSEHWMVRRAATEALCNMASNEHLLQLLRDAEKLKLWLGLCEEGAIPEAEEIPEGADANAAHTDSTDEEEHEKFLTARAASGTLAMAVGADTTVGQALVKLDVARTIVSLLESCQPELVHRALVLVTELATAAEEADVNKSNAVHLVEGGVVAAIGVVLKMGNAQLGGIARDAAQALSTAIGKSS